MNVLFMLQPCKGAPTVSYLASGRVWETKHFRFTLSSVFRNISIDVYGFWPVTLTWNAGNELIRGTETGVELQAVTFDNCKNFVVSSLKIKNAQQMHVAFQDCENVEARYLRVTAPGDSPNTDGIHVTGTQNILISDAVIGTGNREWTRLSVDESGWCKVSLMSEFCSVTCISGDDCISIVDGSSHVGATNIVCGPGHGIRFFLPSFVLAGIVFQSHEQETELLFPSVMYSYGSQHWELRREQQRRSCLGCVRTWSKAYRNRQWCENQDLAGKYSKSRPIKAAGMTC